MINSVNYALRMHDYRFNINHEAKFSLDKRQETRYNEHIKNEVSN